MADFYRVIGLPDVWPGQVQTKTTAQRPRAPFKAGWTDTIRILASECSALRAREITLALDVRMGDVRQDGGIRADARIAKSDVILQLVSADNRLTFPCDAFDFWQDNVRAIALALGDLRRVDRYRVNAGKQYEGFKALPPGGGSSAGRVVEAPLTPEEAAVGLIGTLGTEYSRWELLNVVERAKAAAREALGATHPDRGGSADAFTQTGKEIETLKRHHAAAGRPW